MSGDLTFLRIEIVNRPGPIFGISRCPHAECGVAMPHLTLQDIYEGKHDRYSATLQCSSCLNAILVATNSNADPLEVWPAIKTYSLDIPTRARKSLEDARGTLAHPSPSIMCSAQAIDWMLKDKGYIEGALHGRIEQAAKAHLITEDMKDWAHEVRLGANAERHADPDQPEPTAEEAIRLLKFAEALAELLFELPARVQRGRGKPSIGGKAAKQISKAPPPIAPF